jgi:peptidyl-tRNA hydrolase, PTH1 family
VSNRKLIVGLGNYGGEYAGSRHNTGFAMLNGLAQSHGAQFQEKSKFKGYVAEFEADGEKILLLKPMTFYNLSGEAVRAVCDFYKIANDDVLVVHDELALPFGTIRARTGGSDAGNNGIKSVHQHIGDQFARVRIGVANELRERMDDADFVLSKFSQEEVEKLKKELTPRVGELVDKFIAGDFPHDTHRV